MERMIVVIVTLAVAETAWALFCAEMSVNLWVFYAVLVAVSAVFWIPDRREELIKQQDASSGDIETNR
ncbi:MAG TPA: hypothetical protein VFB30_08955 [Spirochaetia bacterium]|nr:hypothetical protein [Spirochaetia bacterium]